MSNEAMKSSVSKRITSWPVALSQIHAIYEEVLHSPVPLTLSSQFILQFQGIFDTKNTQNLIRLSFFRHCLFKPGWIFLNINVPTAVVTNA